MSEAPDLNVHRLDAPENPILAQWERFKPLVAEAMDPRLYSIELLEQRIAHGRVMFIPGKDAAIIAEIVTYEAGERVMQVLWAVGDLNEVIAMAPGIEALARMSGCGSMLIEGRAAWQKILSPMGYEPWSVTLRKAL